ncbi:hypothetical protein TONV_112 [Tipula oleracea nudivirus]|uniref:Uncharacterized protein n=1 Tax=Tipula oleracea nudivirus TaxID=1546257 RepID=A0A0B4VG23_9VIRU|nr:hypothetical protein TONV_112 [Tipula oleracea nudivirus]AJD20172.1 hypothetical protein TONV_112 [Tipula oleracea nudivirus]
MDIDITDFDENTTVTYNENKPDIQYKLAVPLRVQKSISEYCDLLQTFDSVVTDAFFENYLINLNGWNSTIEILNVKKISRKEAIHNVFELLRSTYPQLKSLAQGDIENDDSGVSFDSLSDLFPLIFHFYETILNNNDVEQIIPTLYSFNDTKHTYDYNDYQHNKGELLSNISYILKSTIGFNTESNILLPLTNTEYITTTIYMLVLLLNTKIIDKNTQLVNNVITPTKLTLNILGCTILNGFTDKCSKVLWIEESTRPSMAKLILSNVYSKFPQLKSVYSKNDFYKIQNEHHNIQQYLNENYSMFNLYPYILTFNFNDKNRILFNISEIIKNFNNDIVEKNNTLPEEQRQRIFGDDFHIQLYDTIEEYIRENKLENNVIIFDEKFLLKLKNIEGFANLLINYLPNTKL